MKSADKAAWWLVAAASLVSCTFDPRVPQGRLICNSKTDCPPGLDFCVTPPGGNDTVCCRNQTCTDRDVDRTDASDAARAADTADTPPPGDVGSVAIDAPVDMSLPPAMATDASEPSDASSDGDASRKGQGVDCTANDECLSGFCTDGLCCDGACKGQCQSCAVVDRLGICVPILGPPWMRPACAGDGPCQGMCNGMNTESCSYPGLATECAPARCGSDVATPAGRCNGTGACVIPDPVSCGGKGCEGVACFGGCSAQLPCPPDRYCQSGRCITKLENSQVCTDSAQCSSGQCVQGVCCDSACTDACASCLQAGRVGTCSPREATVTCRPAEGACDVAEHCDGRSMTCPPDGFAPGILACRPAEGPCDLTENCTGSTGACPPDAYRTTGHLCESASCVGPTFIPARSCSGSSTACPPASPTSCGSYACNPSGCRTSCSSDSDCHSSHFCANMVCTQKKPEGQPCIGNNECAGAICRTFYRDADGDGHGAESASFCGTAPPAGHVATNDQDCCDRDTRAYRCRAGAPCPGRAPAMSATMCNNFDYDCDGVETKVPAQYPRCTFCGEFVDGAGCLGGQTCSNMPSPACGMTVRTTVCSTEHDDCSVYPRDIPIACY